MEAARTSQAARPRATPTADSRRRAARRRQQWSDTREPGDAAERCPQPTIKAQWSKPEVTPLHNVHWPPTDPPRDVVPDEAKVQMLVETTRVPDGTGAIVFIHHCHTDALVREGVLTNLVVRGDRVVHNVTGEPPEFVFGAEQLPWDPWDTPFFYFKVKVHCQDLQTETPKDYRSQEEETLRVLYWHACVGDADADEDRLSTAQEVQAIAALLRARPHHRAAERIFFEGRHVDDFVGHSAVKSPYCQRQCGTCKHFVPDAEQTDPDHLWGECSLKPLGSPERRVKDSDGYMYHVEYERADGLVMCSECLHYKAGQVVEGQCLTTASSGRGRIMNPSYLRRCEAFEKTTFVYCKDCAWFKPDYYDPDQFGTCKSSDPYMGATRQPAAVSRNCHSYQAGTPGRTPDPPSRTEFVHRTTIARWGSVVRNTYSYLHSSHGYTNELALGGTRIKPDDVQRSDDVPSVPRYLAFLSCCLAGRLPDLANAFRARGTRYVIAFRVPVPDSVVRQFSEDFFTAWTSTHKCNPDAIPAVFHAICAPYMVDLFPVLYGDVDTSPPLGLPLFA